MMPETIDFSAIRGKHILAALSGGADSTALLLLLCENKKKFHLQITAAHLNHMIRGAQADADESFCRELCAGLGVNLIHARIDIPSIAASSGCGLETCARNERYRFLRGAKLKCKADLIALAHHADDQVETVLMHLFRGTGPEGICGMSVMSGDLYRPLLNYTKQEIIEWLQDHNKTWCEDCTNQKDDTPRNALRLNILPGIERLYPAFRASVARFTQSAGIENEFLAELTREQIKQNTKSYPCGIRLDTSALPPLAILRRMIRKLCSSDLTFDKLEEILTLIERTDGRVEYKGGCTVERTKHALWFLNDSYTPPAPVPIDRESIELHGIARIHLTVGRFPIQPDDPMTESIDLRFLEGACLRTRQPGDRIHPLGAPGDRLLSDCMIDRKLERPVRDCLPLIASGSRVLWCLGIGIAEELKITAETRSSGRLDIQLFQSEVKP